MGKSSSKRKKKRSTDSSQGKKSTRNKSKKLLRRRDHSDSSEFGNAESSSYSYSSSEDDYRRRKLRSRGRAEGKDSKKRPRRRYSSSESDDDSGRLKKKKRSKRKDDYAGKKRTRPRKRRRRDVSVSSASSGSCSTCPSQSDTGSSSGSEVERRRGKFERRGKDRRRSRRDRPRSCSSRSLDNETDDYHPVRDEFTSEKSSKRLRSIITVATNSNGDESKEEMLCDHDDYPSCRSNDSNDGASKREFERCEASEEKKNVEYKKEGEAVISSPGIGTDEEGHKNSRYDEFGKGDVEMETSRAPDPGNGSKDDDLEAILRMRALENLKRFRGETQRNVVTSNDISSTAEGKSQQMESSKVEESSGPHLVEQKLSVSADIRDLEISQKALLGIDCLKESGSVSRDLASPQDQQSGGTAKEKVSTGVSSSTTRPKLIRPVWRRESLNLSVTSKQATKIQDPQAQSTSGGTTDKSCPESSQTLVARDGSENVKSGDVNDAPNEQSFSYAETPSGSGASGKSQDESKEGSQFEQKTMSVMRGGEMVQVSYKVYIPKKTPALARRKLKR